MNENHKNWSLPSRSYTSNKKILSFRKRSNKSKTKWRRVLSKNNCLKPTPSFRRYLEAVQLYLISKIEEKTATLKWLRKAHQNFKNQENQEISARRDKKEKTTQRRKQRRATTPAKEKEKTRRTMSKLWKLTTWENAVKSFSKEVKNQSSKNRDMSKKSNDHHTSIIIKTISKQLN